MLAFPRARLLLSKGFAVLTPELTERRSMSSYRLGIEEHGHAHRWPPVEVLNPAPLLRRKDPHEGGG